MKYLFAPSVLIARTVELTVTDYEILTLNPSDFRRLGSDVASLVVVPES